MTMDGFSRFPPEALDFLSALKANNDRDWFAQNKDVYERAVKAPAEEFCSVITPRLEKLTGMRHRARIFRIHRDVRFSRDKTPYNAHLHIAFMAQADGPLEPGWFFGLEPQRLVVGTGVFELTATALDAFRARVAGADGDALSGLMTRLERDGVRFGEPELKRVPQPYAADHGNADLLRRKSLTCWLDDDAPGRACRAGFAEDCLRSFTRLKPVFDWLSA